MAIAFLFFALLGAAACAGIVTWSARRLGLPVREALMWFGLLELDEAALRRAAEPRR